MQLNQSQDSPVSGRVGIADNDVVYDSTTARLCGQREEKGRQPCSVFARNGELLMAASNSPPLTLGAWLIQQLEASLQGCVNARCSFQDSTLVEAQGVNGSVDFVIDSRYAQSRKNRHDQRNLINAIQMNASLIRMLAEKSSVERIAQVSDKIVDECQRFDFDAASIDMQWRHNAISMETLRATLDRLVGNTDESAQISCALLVPDFLPGALYHYCHHLLASVTGTTKRAVAVRIEHCQDNMIQIELTGGNPDRPILSEVMAGCDGSLPGGRQHPLGLGHLPPFVTSCALHLKPDSLHLRADFAED